MLGTRQVSRESRDDVIAVDLDALSASNEYEYM